MNYSCDYLHKFTIQVELYPNISDIVIHWSISSFLIAHGLYPHTRVSGNYPWFIPENKFISQQEYKSLFRIHGLAIVGYLPKVNLEKELYPGLATAIMSSEKFS